MEDIAIRPKRKIMNSLGYLNGNRALTVLVIGFIFINALKITIFNMMMLYTVSAAVVAYKFTVTVLLVAILFLFILKTNRSYIFVITYSLQILYCIINLVYFYFFHDYLHLTEIVNLFKEGAKTANVSMLFLDLRFLIVILDLPLFILMALNYSSLQKFISEIKLYRRAVIIACFLILVVNEGRNYASHNFLNSYINDHMNGETSIIERYGTLVNSTMDLRYGTLFNMLVDVSLKRNQITEASQLHYGDQISYNGKNNKKPNFIIIQVESMTANIVNARYKDQYVTPFLHNLTEKSIYYPYLISYHKGGGTSDAEFSILNSVEPLDDYAAIKLRGYNYPNSMIKILNRNSYKTLAYHGNEGGFYNRSNAFYAMGFNAFLDFYGMQLKKEVWGASDKAVFNRVKEDLKTQKLPFFDYIITLSSHEPFKFVEQYGYKNHLFDNIQNNSVEGYFNSLSYVDENIKDFVGYVRSKYKNTYILIFGDHDPAIDSRMYKPSFLTLDNKYFEFVPLFIITPDGKSYREESRVASFQDIAPTVLYSSGVSFKLNTYGIDLIKDLNSEKAIPFKGSEYDRKYLYQRIMEHDNDLIDR